MNIKKYLSCHHLVMQDKFLSSRQHKRSFQRLDSKLATATVAPQLAATSMPVLADALVLTNDDSVSYLSVVSDTRRNETSNH